MINLENVNPEKMTEAAGALLEMHWGDIEHIANILASCILEGQAFDPTVLLDDDEMRVYNICSPLIYDIAIQYYTYWQTDEYRDSLNRDFDTLQ